MLFTIWILRGSVLGQVTNGFCMGLMSGRSEQSKGVSTGSNGWVGLAAALAAGSVMVWSDPSKPGS